MTVAERIQSIAGEYGLDADVELVENPRAGDETLVSEFSVDTAAARETLGWEVRHSIEATVRDRLDRHLD